MTWDIVRKPVFNTKIQTTTSGKELRSAFWAYPVWHYSVHFEFLRQYNGLTELNTLGGFFLARQGAFDSFLWTDPTDSSVANQTIGTGDGSTVAFPAVRTWAGFVEPIGAFNGTPTIYRTDWQGTQQLYSTPRTNLCTKSQKLDDASWTNLIAGTGSNPTVTADYGLGPEGGTTAERIQFNQGVGTTVGDYSLRNTPTLNGLSVGQPLIVSFWAKSNTIPVTIAVQGGTASATNTMVDLTTTLQRFTALLGTAAAVSGVARFGLRGTVTSVLTADITITDFQVEQNGLAAATSFIPTDEAAVTITDYSQIGTTFVFTVAPLPGAVVSWTGSFYYRVRFKQDEAEFNEFMSNLWELKTLEFQSVK
jgi:hypothetical protein